MTKPELEELLVSYGVVFTSELANRLMQDYDKLNSIENVIKICDEAVEKQGSEYGRRCARETAFEHIYKIMKGEGINGQYC